MTREQEIRTRLERPLPFYCGRALPEIIVDLLDLLNLLDQARRERKMSNRGSVLVLSLILTLSLLATGYSMAILSMTELRATHMQVAASQAFHNAESGIDAEIVRMKDETAGAWDSCDETPHEATGFSYVVECADADTRRIISSGTGVSSDGRTITRTIEVYGARIPPVDFYGNALYSANGIELNGSSYSIVGDIITGYTGVIDNTDNVQGDIVQDASAAPLPDLDFERLKTIAISQGNFRDAITVLTQPLPTIFWYMPGIPNIVYVEDSGITLNGNDTVGGFIILVDENVSPAVTMTGNATIEGIIYARGTFEVDGGGQNLNVNGGVFAGDITVLNGGIDIQVSQEYMDAVRDLNVTLDFPIVSWRECKTINCT